MENLGLLTRREWLQRESELRDAINEGLNMWSQVTSARIQYTRFNSVVITVFRRKLYDNWGTTINPDPGYRQYFAKNVQDFSANSLREIVLPELRILEDFEAWRY